VFSLLACALCVASLRLPAGGASASIFCATGSFALAAGGDCVAAFCAGRGGGGGLEDFGGGGGRDGLFPVAYARTHAVTVAGRRGRLEGLNANTALRVSIIQ